MTVKEVVLMAAEELRISTEVAEYFSGTSTVGQAKADLLLTCYNLVENELALDYFSLSKEETLVSTGQVAFSKLKNAPLQILKVTDIYGQDLEYALYANYIDVQMGAVKITYIYAPNAKKIGENSEFSANVSARLMSFGIASEYCMATGAFEEAALWDKKYKDAIAAINQSTKGGRMTSRRWA